MLSLFYAAIIGVAAYNNHKLKKEASRGSTEESESSQPTVTATSSNSK